MNMISLLLDPLRGSSHITDICQVTRHELQTFIILTKGDSLAVPPVFAGSVECALTPGYDIYCRDAMEKELRGDL